MRDEAQARRGWFQKLRGSSWEAIAAVAVPLIIHGLTTRGAPPQQNVAK